MESQCKKSKSLKMKTQDSRDNTEWRRDPRRGRATREGVSRRRLKRQHGVAVRPTERPGHT
jgi:hypothetical protein